MKRKLGRPFIFGAKTIMRVFFRLTKSHVDKLDKIAKKRGETVNELCRQIVLTWLEKGL